MGHVVALLTPPSCTLTLAAPARLPAILLKKLLSGMRPVKAFELAFEEVRPGLSYTSAAQDTAEALRPMQAGPPPPALPRHHNKHTAPPPPIPLSSDVCLHPCLDPSRSTG